MGFLDRLLGPPPLTPADFSDFRKVAAFVIWCLDNDPTAKQAINPAAEALYQQGHRPKAGEKTDPTSARPLIVDLREWVMVQVYMMLNGMQAASQEEWCMLLSFLSDGAKEMGAEFSKWGERTGIDLETLPRFNLNLVAARLPDLMDQWLLFQEYLDATVFAGELRIYGLWYRHRYGQWPRYYTRGETEDWCERKGRLPVFMQGFEAAEDAADAAQDSEGEDLWDQDEEDGQLSLF